MSGATPYYDADGNVNCIQEEIDQLGAPHSVFWGPGAPGMEGWNGSRYGRCHNIQEKKGYCRERGPKKEIAFDYDCSKADKHGDKCTINHRTIYSGGELTCINGNYKMTEEPERPDNTPCENHTVNDGVIPYVINGGPLTHYLKAETYNCRNATNEGEECSVTPINDRWIPGKITCDTKGWYTITPGVWRG